jgi:hypothetical protein
VCILAQRLTIVTTPCQSNNPLLRLSFCFRNRAIDNSIPNKEMIENPEKSHPGKEERYVKRMLTGQWTNAVRCWVYSCQDRRAQSATNHQSREGEKQALEEKKKRKRNSLCTGSSGAEADRKSGRISSAGHHGRHHQGHRHRQGHRHDGRHHHRGHRRRDHHHRGHRHRGRRYDLHGHRGHRRHRG